MGADPDMLTRRGTEAMLWRGVMAACGDAAAADAALAAVHAASARPNAASESRMLRVALDTARRRAHGSGAPSDDRETARRLVRGGVPTGVAARAMDVSVEEVEAWVGEGVGAGTGAGVGGGPGGGPERATEGPAPRGPTVAPASDDDVRLALSRVDAMTVGLRRRRAVLNSLKFVAFGVALLLVVYVMFDLRKAADLEREGRNPGDVFSLPMPNKERGVP